MSEFVKANNVTLHCSFQNSFFEKTDSQTGMPIVFMNSLGSNFHIWDEVAKELTNPVLLYDKRGHGLSDAPIGPYSIADHAEDLAALLAHFKLKRVLLVGISVGGQVALEFASRFPEHVAGAIFCDTGMKIGNPEFWQTRITTVQHHGLEHVSAQIIERWLSKNFIANNPVLSRGYQNMLERTPVAGYVATCQALRDSDLTTAAKKILEHNTKTLVLCGELDQSTSMELSVDLAKVLNTHLEVVKNSGHLPCIENPKFVATTIKKFLTEVGA